MKAMHDLKVVTVNYTLACFFRRPVGGGTEESASYMP